MAVEHYQNLVIGSGVAGKVLAWGCGQVYWRGYVVWPQAVPQ